MRFKIFWLIFFIILAALAYFAFPIVCGRYFNDTAKKIEIIPKDESSPTKSGEIIDQSNISPDGSAKKTDETGAFPNISAKDCDNECKNFKDVTANLTYCQEICGFAPAKNDSDCENKSGLEKDYCLKDSGIAKKDFKFCEQIQDTGIKKTCKDRITEDIIEGQ